MKYQLQESDWKYELVAFSVTSIRNASLEMSIYFDNQMIKDLAKIERFYPIKYRLQQVLV